MTDTEIINYIERHGVEHLVWIYRQAQTYCSMAQQIPAPSLRTTFAIGKQMGWLLS